MDQKIYASLLDDKNAEVRELSRSLHGSIWGLRKKEFQKIQAKINNRLRRVFDSIRRLCRA